MSWAFLVTCTDAWKPRWAITSWVIWLARSTVGGAHVALGVGERVVGGVHEAALGVALGDAGDLYAAVGPRAGHDHLGLERGLVGGA